MPIQRIANTDISTTGSFSFPVISGNTVIQATDNTNAALRITQLGTGNALLVEDSTNPDSTPFIVNTDGRLLIGQTSVYTVDPAGSPPLVQISNVSGQAAYEAIKWNAASSFPLRPPTIRLAVSDGASTGTQGIVVDGRLLGSYEFLGSDGTAFIRAATIQANIDGTPGTNDMPGRLVFSTTADGASTPTERMRIDSSGNVGIGITTPTAKLHVTNTGAGDSFLVEDSANPDATPVVIDNAGRQVIGYTSVVESALNVPSFLQVHATGAGASVSATRWSNNAVQSLFVLSKSRSSTVGTYGVAVQSGDAIGSLVFTGDDGTAPIQAASITAEVDGTPGTNDMPGRLVFSTTADGASSPTERMRIDSSGNVGIGTTAPQQRLGIKPASNVPQLYLIQDNVANDGWKMFADSSAGYLSFLRTASGSDTERMRITAAGLVGIGTNNPETKLQVEGIADTVGATFRITSTGVCSSGLACNATGLFFAVDTGGFIWKTGTQNLPTTGGTERMRIDSSGDLLIGLTSGSSKLMVSNTLNFTHINNGNSTVNGTSPWLATFNNANAALATYGWGFYDSNADGNLSLWRRNDSTTGVKTAEWNRGNGNFSFDSGYGSAAVAYGCRVWVNFNGTNNTIRGSGNVSSISDPGIGQANSYDINFVTAMPDANFAVSSIGSHSPGVTEGPVDFLNSNGIATGRVRIQYRGNGGNQPQAYMFAAIFR